MPAVEHKIRSQVPNAPSGPDLFYKVDDFSGRADLFLCTHFHADHLAGLDDRWAERQTAQIVTSTQTAHMLRKRFPALACDLLIHSARGQRRMPRVLAFEIEPTMQHNIIVDHQQEHSVTVTLIDANHCPGSVMFVVDSGCGKRLHTGDFRFDAELHLPDNCAALQGLREVHMDTTFFDPSWVLPTKSESIQMVTEIVRSQAVEEKKRPVILAVDMLGQEEILSAVQRNLRDSHGHIVLPLNRCNEELMNRNAFTVWNAWLDPKMCPTMSGVVERAGQCRHCQICAPDTVPCSRDTQPTALGKSGAQGGGGHMDVEDGRLYSEGCAQRPLDTAAGAVAGGREAVKTGKEGVGNENKCCDWARTPGKIAMIACTYWRRKRAARGKRNLVHGTQPATAVTDRPAASASDAISKARIQPEDSQSNISAGINLQNLAHKMIGRRTPSMIDAVKLCLAERRIESGEQGAPSAAHPSRTCYPSSNYIGDVRRYYQHRHEEVVVVRCSTLAFGTREADSPEDKPCDADLVKRGNVGNIKYRSDNFWRVLFSMHSSYPELVRFHDAVMDASSQVSFFHSLPGQDKHGKEIPEELFQRKPDAKFVEACGRPIAVQVKQAFELKQAMDQRKEENRKSDGAFQDGDAKNGQKVAGTAFSIAAGFSLDWDSVAPGPEKDSEGSQAVPQHASGVSRDDEAPRSGGLVLSSRGCCPATNEQCVVISSDDSCVLLSSDSSESAQEEDELEVTDGGAGAEIRALLQTGSELDEDQDSQSSNSTPVSRRAQASPKAKRAAKLFRCNGGGVGVSRRGVGVSSS